VIGEVLTRALWVAAVLYGRRMGVTWHNLGRAARAAHDSHWRLVHDLSAQIGNPPYPRCS
jgi:hypothetical protein